MSRYVTSIPIGSPDSDLETADFVLVKGFVRPSKDGSEWDVELLETDPPGAMAELTEVQRELAKDRLAHIAHEAEKFAAFGHF